MHLERVGAVFQLVVKRVRVERQLARLADRHEADVQLQRQRRGKDEPARLGRGDDVDLRIRDSARPSARWPRERPRGLPNSGVMSRNRMPGLGKSGMARM